MTAWYPGTPFQSATSTTIAEAPFCSRTLKSSVTASPELLRSSPRVEGGLPCFLIPFFLLLNDYMACVWRVQTEVGLKMQDCVRE
eukprot:2417211-Rhodomonas_salina.1